MRPGRHDDSSSRIPRKALLRTHHVRVLGGPLLAALLTVAPAAVAADPEQKTPDLPAARLPASPEFKPIFDGKTLTGWKAIGGAKWSVSDGAIVGQTGDGSYGWLIYEKPVADFVLEFEARCDAHGNSGIQFRSHVLDGGEMCGYQAEFDPDNEKVGCTGGIYDEGPGGRGWLFKPDCAKIKTIQKPMGQWNTYRIEAIGTRIRTWLNGEAITDLRDHQLRSGIIALQVHSGRNPVHVSFRGLRLADLGDGTGWKPLFNGKDLEGWRTQGEKNVWHVEDGQIVGELVKPSPYAYLATRKKFADFELKLDMKFDSDQGNSGVFFRCSFPPWHPECGPASVARNLPEEVIEIECPKCGAKVRSEPGERVHIHGPQAEFAPAKDTGSPTAAVYDARGHGWVNVKKITDHMRKMNREKDWNELRLLARGDHVMTWLNGYLISDIRDYDFPDEGIIALQMHETRNPIKVRFRNIQIREVE